MSSPPPTVVAAARATELGERVLGAAGAPAAAARAQVRQLVEGDLRGRASHGMQRLPTLVERIRHGVLDPVAEPRIERRAPAAIAVDGRGGFGPVAAEAALGPLREAARENSVALAAIRGSGHVGMLAPYLERLAAAGAIGLAFTTSEALVHPAGGREAMVGTNPIGVGVPLRPQPFILDMSTAAISAGEVIAHRERGEALPPGAAVDFQGRPTVDPVAALEGAISPFGGGKGYGLGLAIELLVAALTATALGGAVHGTLDADEPPTKGDLLIAIDPAGALGGPLDERPIIGYLAELREVATAPGVERVMVPGDRMRETRQRRLRDGIPYARATWERLAALEREAGGDVRCRRATASTD